MLANWSGGGLYGYATVINVPQGAAFSYDAIAIADHVADGASGYAMHYEPGTIYPNFTDSTMDTAAIVSLNGQAVTLDFSSDYPSAGVERIQALNATIMATEIYNDYVTDKDLFATTDWLLTFPIKAFHINDAEPIQPFSQKWVGNSACEPAAFYSVDREESQPAEPPAPGPLGRTFRLHRPHHPAQRLPTTMCRYATNRPLFSLRTNLQLLPVRSRWALTRFSRPRTAGQSLVLTPLRSLPLWKNVISTATTLPTLKPRSSAPARSMRGMGS